MPARHGQLAVPSVPWQPPPSVVLVPSLALALPLESASSDVLAVPFALEVSPIVDVTVAPVVAVSEGRTHSPERHVSPAKH